MMKPKNIVQEMPKFEDLSAAMDEYCAEEDADLSAPTVARKISPAYRKSALAHYVREIAGSMINVCAMCGFGIRSILEVAHLDQNRQNCDLENLAVLCPNCHKMHDIGLIPTEVVKQMRGHVVRENWGIRIKDAGLKAADTRRKKAVAVKKSASAKKAWETREKRKNITLGDGNE